jgi:hypothetical protein
VVNFRLPEFMPRHRYTNHTGTYEGVHRTKWRARWQIIGMLSVGGGIIGVLIWLSLSR